VPSESEIADAVPTRTRTPGTPASPGSGRSLPLSSRKIRPEMPERSSDGPGAAASRPVARSHSSEPCTNCEPVTVPPAGAVTVVYERRADKYDVSESVRTTPGAPRSQVTPASIRNPEPMGRAANTEQLESRGTPSRAISVPPRSQRGPRTGPSVGCGSTNAFTPTNDCVTA